MTKLFKTICKKDKTSTLWTTDGHQGDGHKSTKEWTRNHSDYKFIYYPEYQYSLFEVVWNL